MSEVITVRDIDDNDRAGWELLWRGYHKHLRTRIADSIVEDSWAKIIDPNEPVLGFVAVIDTYRLAGFTHVSFAPSTWARGPLCHLQDLYVDVGLRGKGAGNALIQKVFAVADDTKCSQVFWHIDQHDMQSRFLFDKYSFGSNGKIAQFDRKLAR